MQAVLEMPAAPAAFDPALLDESVEGVMFRFSLMSTKEVSPALWLKDAQAICRVEKTEIVSPRTENTQFISGTAGVSVLAFLDDIKRAGWAMASLATQEWQDSGERRLAIRFIYHRTPFNHPPVPAMQELIDKYGISSHFGLSTGCAWKTSVFRNALGEGHFGIAVNSLFKKPLSSSTGAIAASRHTLRLADNQRIVLA